MAAAGAALSFAGGPLAAPGRSAGFAACPPLRKSILRRQAAPLLPARQAPARHETPAPRRTWGHQAQAAPRQAAPSRGSSQPRTFQLPSPSAWPGRLIYVGWLLFCALFGYWMNYHIWACHWLLCAVIVLLGPA